MLISNPTSLARVLGVGICFCSVGCTFWISLVALYRVEHWAYAIMLLPAWAFFSIGEWFWRCEGGWFGLQRWLRILEYTLISGTLILPLLIGPIYKLVVQ
jgi:hypothetical protein